ncbi:MAG: cysteine hydrolase [Candidatus Rokubacteria bacterium]|nr:cysteine hydrolase [Candidatus Rokubacteria bacterium]
MRPPVEFQDRSEYKARMNALLTIDPRRTVVATVDMQRDYLDLEVGAAPVAADEAERVVKHARDLLDFARAEGMPVVHVYVNRRPVEIERGFHPGETFRVSREHRLSQNAQAGVRRIPDRLEGSPQAEVPAILVAPGDVHVTTKKSLDGFLDTDLDLLLRRVYRAETVVLTGINTDTCVYSTAFSASNRGYKTIVISDCVASMRGKDHHWMALELMSRSIAWVLTVEEFKEKVRAVG